MKKQTKTLFFILLRYFFVLFLGLGNLFLIYKVFSFPTIFVSYKFLSFFGETYYIDNIIIFNDSLIEIIGACVAGSAYYLLLILSMSFPLKPKKRFFLITFLIGIFFIINILRIVFMVFILKTEYFEKLHFLIWNFFSIALVVCLWFLGVWLFKIKEIPFYKDFKFLLSLINQKKK